MAAEEKKCVSRAKFKVGLRAVAGLLALFLLSGCSFFLTENTYIIYPVKSGDTLFEIAQRFDVSVAELQSINQIGSPKSLLAGTELKIPYLGQDVRKRESDRQNAVIAMKGGVFEASKGQSGAQISLGAAQGYIGKLLFPVPSSAARLSSNFGRRWFNFHEGIDISGAQGTKIYAAHDGQVVYSGSGINGYGNIIVIRAPALMTIYAHNRKNYVRSGQRVTRGEHIADLGKTGRASGPHLHFETRIRTAAGKYAAVDPLVFFR